MIFLGYISNYPLLCGHVMNFLFLHIDVKFAQYTCHRDQANLQME